jgi:hypothetical protein
LRLGYPGVFGCSWGWMRAGSRGGLVGTTDHPSARNRGAWSFHPRVRRIDSYRYSDGSDHDKANDSSRWRGQRRVGERGRGAGVISSGDWPWLEPSWIFMIREIGAQPSRSDWPPGYGKERR